MSGASALGLLQCSVRWHFHYTLHGACNRWWTRPNGSSSRHQSATTSRRPTPITLAESSMADRLQAGRSGLQMFSWPGTIIPRWLTSLSSSVGVLKASACAPLRLTNCLFPVPTLNLQRPSFSSRRSTDLEQSSAAYHICSVTSCLLLSLEDLLLRTLIPVITVVVPAKWNCHLWTREQSKTVVSLFPATLYTKIRLSKR